MVPVAEVAVGVVEAGGGVGAAVGTAGRGAGGAEMAELAVTGDAAARLFPAAEFGVGIITGWG